MHAHYPLPTTSMSVIDEYISNHAPALLRLELAFALCVIAAGCGMALYGACHSHSHDAHPGLASLSEQNTNANTKTSPEGGS